MSKATPKITIKQSTDASGVTHIMMEQNVMGMKSKEQFVLDWSARTSSKGPFGEVKGKPTGNINDRASMEAMLDLFSMY